MKNNVSNIKIPKEPINPDSLPQLIVTADISTYQNVRIDYTHNL